MKKTLILFLQFFLLVTYSQSKKPISKFDYTFGFKNINKIKNKLEKKEFIKAETLIQKLSSDELTTLFDCVTLNLTEKLITDWNEKLNSSDYSKMALAVYYSHKGWNVRGNSYASDVSIENHLSFDEYQTKAKEILEKINSKNQKILEEKYSRLVRIYMSLGETEKEDLVYEKCKSIDSNKVWLYIHRLESVQPKWDGSLSKLNTFLKQIPENLTIKIIVKLKLVTDSYVIGENYFENEDKSIKQKIKEIIISIDKELDNNSSISSINKFIIYGYLTSLSQEINETRLLYKYFPKMKEIYTLYPFGIMK